MTKLKIVNQEELKEKKEYNKLNHILKLIYNQKAPFALPLDSLGEVDKKIVDQVMDKTVLDFFNYSLKGQPFNIKNNDTYNNQVIYNIHP